MKIKKKQKNIFIMIGAITSLIIISTSIILFAQFGVETGRWIKADFHMHTTMSDGDFSPKQLAKHAFDDNGLDVIAITDHGGHFFRVNHDFLRTDDKGNIFEIKNFNSLIATDVRRFKNCSRTTQLLEYSFPEVLRLRNEYKDKLVIQGLEWDIPGHDHGVVGIISESGTDISDFNYIFDRNDTLSNWKPNLVKHNSGHANSLVGLEYLKDKYSDESYFIVNHPSRKLQYTISDFRDFNNTAPNIAIGFEGFPGHQINPKQRCKYGKELGDGINYHSKTYGGADFMLAKIGGLWDALLGEGRRFWVFTNSDFHRPTEDSWPGEYSKNYIWGNDVSYKSLIDGMRSGKIFISSGNLIYDLNFTAESNGIIAEIGESLKIENGSRVTIKIGLSTKSIRDNEISPKLDHVDLIGGNITGIKLPKSVEYNIPINSSTKILKRFTNDESVNGSDGFRYFTYSYIAEKSQYFRLRGTNIPIKTENETDEKGNPLCDVLTDPNTEKIAFNDLWFYANPIFIEVNE